MNRKYPPWLPPLKQTRQIPEWPFKNLLVSALKYKIEDMTVLNISSLALRYKVWYSCLQLELSLKSLISVSLCFVSSYKLKHHLFPPNTSSTSCGRKHHTVKNIAVGSSFAWMLSCCNKNWIVLVCWWELLHVMKQTVSTSLASPILWFL